jgi:hypothetical protein
MPKVHTLPGIEDWLDAAATSWRSLTAAEYAELVARWSAAFRPVIEAGNPTSRGHRAVSSLESRLPCEVILFSGVSILRLANRGGRGPAAYLASGLRALDRALANELELIVASADLSWCCVFSHEAGDFVWEELFDHG